MAIKKLGLEPIEELIDACDLCNNIIDSMETYHVLLCSMIKDKMMHIDPGSRAEVSRTMTGLDSLFDSIRIKSDTLSRFLNDGYSSKVHS